MGPDAVLCLIVDVDGFLARAARAEGDWAGRVVHRLRRLVDQCVVEAPGVRVEHLPPDEWLVLLEGTDAEELRIQAARLATLIHQAVRRHSPVTATVAVGRPAEGAQAGTAAQASARRVHRSKLARGGDRVIWDESFGQAPTPLPVGAPPAGVHREVARHVSRSEAELAGRVLMGWFAAAVRRSGGDDELVRRWLLGQVLATTAVLDGRLGAGTAADWMAVCEAVPYDAWADLGDLHESAAVAQWVDRVVAAMVRRHQGQVPRGSTLELVQAHVDEHFTDPGMRLEGVAREVGVSPFHVSHLFRSALDTTFRDYVTQRRVRRARQLLAGTRVGMTEVAQASGFASAVQLRRVLVREVGVTPSEVRAAAR